MQTFDDSAWGQVEQARLPFRASGIDWDLRRDGTTIVLTTQYLEEADRLADRISVVDAGRIIAEGTDWRFLNELKRELKA